MVTTKRWVALSTVAFVLAFFQFVLFRFISFPVLIVAFITCHFIYTLSVVYKHCFVMLLPHGFVTVVLPD